MKRIALLLLVIFYFAAGVNHFVMPGFYIRMIPDYLPLPELLNHFSGAAEIILAVLVASPSTRRIGGIGIVLLLIAVFPANVDMVVHRTERFPEFSPLVVYARLPMQLVLIWWAWWATGKQAV